VSTFDIATATECPKCGLQAKTLLHRFCTHKACPVREALAAKKAAEPTPEVAQAAAPAISDDWQQKHDFDREGLLTIIGNIDGPDDGQFHYTTICEEVGGRTPEEALANANLIAAAPELLRELMRAVDMADPTGVDADYHAARAAIAKATGQSGAA
jgi:hypothetical protein